MSPQRIIVGIFEGLGYSDYTAFPLLTMKSMAAQGLFKQVTSTFPSTGLSNTASIICGAWPEAHGIVFATPNPALSTAVPPTLFQRARANNAPSAFLTSTRKVFELFGDAVAVDIAPHSAKPRIKPASDKTLSPDSEETNLWLWQTAIDLLKTRPDIKLLCIHTNDAPMHRRAPNQPSSVNYMTRLDQLIAQAQEAAPDAAFFLTATHGMNVKKRCWDLAKVCQTNGYPLKCFRTPENELNETGEPIGIGCASISLEDPEDETRVREIIDSLEGIESILPNRDATIRFHLPSKLLGDLMILGDRDTVFGELQTAGADLGEGHRAHGSLHETEVPLITYNYAGMLPSIDMFESTKDLTRFLYR